MRALQPPFSKFLTKLVPNQKWDAAQNLRYRQRYLKFMCFVGILCGLQGFIELFETRMKLMGSFFIVLAIVNVIAFFIGMRKLQKVNQ
jgi:purine-cytosine permease-like protein